MAGYDPKTAPREVNMVVTAFVLRLVRTGLYESPFELEGSYRERLRVLGCGAAYIESVMIFGRNAAQIIRAQVEPVREGLESYASDELFRLSKVFAASRRDRHARH